jgi:hypothetical protein
MLAREREASRGVDDGLDDQELGGAAAVACDLSKGGTAPGRAPERSCRREDAQIRVSLGFGLLHAGRFAEY